MITKEQCADYINANIATVLTDDEILTLRNSLNNFGMDSQGNVNKDMRKYLVETLIEILGDVTMLVEIRDAS
tara:strand:+ start:647 stop:862 length:216 start_codon:yes stop_codon:yes gene_type:complete